MGFLDSCIFCPESAPAAHVLGLAQFLCVLLLEERCVQVQALQRDSKGAQVPACLTTCHGGRQRAPLPRDPCSLLFLLTTSHLLLSPFICAVLSSPFLAPGISLRSFQSWLHINIFQDEIFTQFSLFRRRGEVFLCQLHGPQYYCSEALDCFLDLPRFNVFKFLYTHAPPDSLSIYILFIFLVHHP